VATVTEDEVMAPEVVNEDRLYEFVDGRRSEKSVGYREILLANRLCFFINKMILEQGLGIAAVEALIDLGQAGRSQLRPDLAFVSADRWPVDSPETAENAWPVVPDLAVEVVSPTNTAQEIEDKTVAYLAAGVRLVWIIYPTTGRIYAHEGLTAVRVITRDGELDGGAVLPGFRLPMSKLFPARTDRPA